MKSIRRLLTALIALIMMIGMGVMAKADDGEGAEAGQTPTYTITVKDGYKGETYTAYKIFDVRYSGTSYAYTIDSLGQWFNDIVGATVPDSNGDYTLTQYGIKFQKTSTEGEYNVVNAVEDTNPTEEQIAALAAELAKHTDGKTAAGTGTVPKEEGDEYGAKAVVTIQLDPNEAGYYFVTTTTGALCALNTTDSEAKVEEKNDLPQVDKKHGTADTYTDDKINLSVGETVHYQITVTDGKGTDSVITLTDTMSAGLTYTAGSIKINGTAVADDADTDNWNVAVSGQTITITLKASYVSTLTETDSVVITYDAMINESAITSTEDGTNSNTVVIEYAHQQTEDKVEFETFKFQLVKDDKDNSVLTGAKFQLYASEDASEPIALIKNDNIYRPLKAGEDEDTAGYTTEIEAGTPVFRGFKAGTYWFEETEAPEGYNKLTGRVSIEITADNVATIENEVYVNGGLEVENNTGSELPSTGGMGTTIFYTIGGILVLCAGVLLVSRRRMSE